MSKFVLRIHKQGTLEADLKCFLPVAHCAKYSTEAVSIRTDANMQKIRNPDLATMKRGPGGRSSFSGNVCTIFGATGYLGKYVVNRLARDGNQVIIPYRGAVYPFVAPMKVFGDLGQILFSPYYLRDYESIKKAVKYSNVVINLVGRDWETWNFTFDDVHVKGARDIARACKEAGVEKFIHLSALNCSPEPPIIHLPAGSEFLKSKWRGEQVVREEFPDAIIFRPADIWGEMDRFFCYYGYKGRLFPKTLCLWKKGEQTVKQPVSVYNMAAGICKAVFDQDAIGKVYECVGPKRYLLSDLADYLMAVMGKDKEWGYTRTDYKYNIPFQIYLSCLDKFFLVAPYSRMTWERFEREHVSDTLTKGCYGLEDLDVELDHIEDKVQNLTYFMHAYAYYEPQPFEFPLPPPPPTVN